MDARSALSLHMLMNSVEHAADLVEGAREDALKTLKPDSGSPPYIRLVQS
jgi:hypothetical protein